MRLAARLRCWLVAVVSGTSIAVLAAHRPGPLVAHPDDPTSAVVGAAAWAAWAIVGYLLAATCAVALGQVRDGGPVARLARASAPRAVRRLVEAAAGAGTAAVVATLVPVAAYADAPAPAPTVASVDWPGLAPHPAPAAAPAAPPPPVALISAAGRRGGDRREQIVVRAGDSLWSLTARALGPGASSVDIAAAWPRLYAANRAVIGADPDLIRPGQRLAPPASNPRSPR